MTTKEEYRQLYNNVKTVQEWVDVLNDKNVNFFEMTEALSNYKPGDVAFWKIAEIKGDWEFDASELDDPVNLATELVHTNTVASEKEMLERAGYCLGYNRHMPGELTQRIVDSLNLENVNANINLQPPNSVKNLHMDTLTCYYRDGMAQDFSNLEFDPATRQPKDFPQLYRILVALTDWQPGWMFQLGVDQWVNWKKGDVIALDWLNVAHSTANASFVSRPLLKITASAKDNWIADVIKNNTFKTITI